MPDVADYMLEHCQAHNGMCRAMDGTLCDYAHLHHDGEAECTVGNPITWIRHGGRAPSATESASNSGGVAGGQGTANTGNPKLPLDIDVIDKAVCNQRGWGFDTDELELMNDIVIPIIERQLRAGA